jgi:hypothetical protein
MFLYLFLGVLIIGKKEVQKFNVHKSSKLYKTDVPIVYLYLKIISLKQMQMYMHKYRIVIKNLRKKLDLLLIK